MRINFLGDSITEGIGDAKGLGWVGRLAIPEGYSRYNLGIRGETMNKITARAARECAARIMPNVNAGIVLGAGLNDLCYLDDKLRTSKQELIETIDELVGKLKSLAPLIVIGPFCLDEQFNPFYSDAIGKELDFRNALIADIDHEYVRICAHHNVPYLPMHHRLMNDPIYRKSLKDSDGIHPTEIGYIQVTKIIENWEGWQKLIAIPSAN